MHQEGQREAVGAAGHAHCDPGPRLERTERRHAGGEGWGVDRLHDLDDRAGSRIYEQLSLPRSWSACRFVATAAFGKSLPSWTRATQASCRLLMAASDSASFSRFSGAFTPLGSFW